MSCPKVRRLCEDGRYREFDCCDTGMRSGGWAHDGDCVVAPSMDRGTMRLDGTVTEPRNVIETS